MVRSIETIDIAVNRHCRQCGKGFIAYRANTQFCSFDCRMLAWRREKAAERPKELRICKGCGVEILTSDARKIFCTKDCRYKYFNSLRPTTKSLKRTCPNCGKVFIADQKAGVGKAYCTVNCRKASYRKKWDDARKAKQAAWQKKNKWGGKWVAAVERDKFTCQMCGKKMPPEKWSRSSQLEVHHLDGSGEKETKNHELDNLITLCHTCHKGFHTKVNLVMIDGKFYVRGEIFTKLGITALETIE